MTATYTQQNKFCNFLEVVTFVVQKFHISLSEQFKFYSKSLKDKAREGFGNLSLLYCFTIWFFCSARPFCSFINTFQEMQKKKRESKTPSLEAKVDAVYCGQWPRIEVSEDNPVLIITPPAINFQLPRIGITYDKPDIPSIKIQSSEMAHQLLLANWDSNLQYVQEQFCVLFLNNASEVIGFKEISKGSLTATCVDISLILAVALLARAAKMIVAHNHPSGNLIPSKADLDLTRRLHCAAKVMDIQLLDHIILGKGDYASLADSGFIDIYDKSNPSILWNN